MKKTDTINYGVGVTALIEVDSSCTFFQITATGTTGALKLEAQTNEAGPFEPVLATAIDTDAIRLSLVTPATCRVGPYSIKQFKLSPESGAAAYSITFSQWSE